jgi:hypothetical protein
MKQVTKYIITSLLLIVAVNAKAVVVSVSPSIQTISVNEQILLDVFYDTEGISTIGGVFSVNFDNNAFDFIGVEFDSNLSDDSAFRVFPTEAVNGNAFNLGFASFSGFDGAGKVATLTFLAQQEGLFDFILDNPLPGHDAFPEGASYIDAQVQVNAVPLPAASWLLLSSFVSLVAVGRRKRIG